MSKHVFCCVLIILLASGCAEDSIEVRPSGLEFSDTIAVFGWEGGDRTIEIIGVADWSVGSILPSWLEMREDGESIVLIAGLNDHTKERRCDVVIVSEDEIYVLKVIQRAKSVLSFLGDRQLSISQEESELEIELVTNVRFRLDVTEESTSWLMLKSGVGSSLRVADVMSDTKVIRFGVMPNRTESSRTAQIIISESSGNLSDTLWVTQEAGRGWYSDGDVITLRYSKKAGAQLVFMGDGFLEKDLGVGGKYEAGIYEAIEHFFGIEPYKTYSDYFNVYMVVAESEDEGVGEKNSLSSSFSNRFGSAYGAGTEIVCNERIVFEYARKPETILPDDVVTAVVVLNDDKYAGTAYLFRDGNSIALCPLSTAESPYDFRGIVQHEAGGHAFGFLADEYVYFDQEMPQSRVDEIKAMQEFGFHLNLDFTSDAANVLWSGFLGHGGYDNVGLFEGGYEYQYGVWRCEENSCMNNNVPYYNAQSRWAIYRRIMLLSGLEADFETFVSYDSHADYSVFCQTKGMEVDFVHLHPPKLHLK